MIKHLIALGQDNPYWGIAYVIICLFVLIQFIKHAERISEFFGKMRIAGIFTYHSGHGRHAIDNPLAQFAVTV